MDNWTTRFTSSRIAPGVFNFKTADDEPWNFLEQLLADLGLPTATSQSMFSNGYRSTPILGYARISTQDQDASLQIQALEAAGCLKIYIDNASGSTTKRPELDKLGP